MTIDPHDETPLQAAGRALAAPGRAEAVLGALIEAVGDAVAVLGAVVRGDQDVSEQALLTLASPEAGRVDTAKFLLGHAAPLLAELRALRGEPAAAEPGGPSPVRRG